MTLRWMRRLDGLYRIGFDTNALIYYLERRPTYYGYIAQAIDMMASRIALGVVSAVVEMELLVKPTREGDDGGKAEVETFLRNQPNVLIRTVDRTIARRAAEVRAQNRLAPLDAIIVATCLEERCDAIIGNDFQIARRITEIPYILLDDYIDS